MTYKPSQELLDRAAALGKPLVNSHRAKQLDTVYARKQEAWRSGKIWDYFWPKVDQSGGPDACWPWLKSTQNGYGRVIIHRTVMYSHRVAAMLRGKLDGPTDPHQIRITCGNKLCCNPKHMTVHDPVSLAYGAPQPAPVQAIEKPTTTRKPRGPNKRKGLPTGWVSPARQAWIDAHTKPDKQDG